MVSISKVTFVNQYINKITTSKTFVKFEKSILEKNRPVMLVTSIVYVITARSKN